MTSSVQRQAEVGTPREAIRETEKSPTGAVQMETSNSNEATSVRGTGRDGKQHGNGGIPRVGTLACV